MPNNSRSRTPSKALFVGGTSATVGAPLILWLLTTLGVPLPADPATAAQLGAALAGLFGAATGWLTRGGRRGESD